MTPLERCDLAVSVLTYLEWSGTANWTSDDGTEHEGDCCPVCGASREGSMAGDGVHADDCELEKAIRP